MRRFRPFADHRPRPAPLASSPLCRVFQALANRSGAYSILVQPHGRLTASVVSVLLILIILAMNLPADFTRRERGIRRRSGCRVDIGIGGIRG